MTDPYHIVMRDIIDAHLKAKRLAEAPAWQAEKDYRQGVVDGLALARSIVRRASKEMKL